MIKYTFFELIVEILFAGILVYASVCDIRERRIPGICSLLIFGLGMFVPCPDRFLGAVCVSIPMLLLSVATGGSFGGGDIKLMAAGGFFMGAAGILRAFVIGIFAAGMYCFWLLLWKRQGKRSEFALGPFLSAGMLAVYFMS